MLESPPRPFTPAAAPLRVAIIGAGIGGLSCAYRLMQQLPGQVQITLLEAEPCLGGLAGSFTATSPAGESIEIEKFYHHLFLRDQALVQLLEELGLGTQLQWRPARTGAYYFGRPWALSRPWDLLRFAPLSLLGRLRMGYLMLQARRRPDWAALDGISARDYILQKAGGEVYRTLWEPLLRGKFGADAEQVSAAWLVRKLVDRGQSRRGAGPERLGYVAGGFGPLFQAMATCLQQAGHHLHLDQRVDAILLDEKGQVAGVAAGSIHHPADVVIAACHTPQLAEMLVPDSPEVAAYRAQLLQIRYLANVCLVLLLDRSLSAFYWTNVTDPSAPFVGLIEQTQWTGVQAYGGHHLVYLSAYVPAEDPRLQMRAETLLALYLPHIRKLFPAFETSWVRAQYLWQAPYAQPIVHTGYGAQLPGLRSPIPGLYLCTMAQIYPHDRQLANGVEMAQRCVAAILADH